MGCFRVAAAILIAPIMACSPLAGAADYPSKPVYIVVGQPAGSTVDLPARVLADKFSARWGQPIIVDNRPGAGEILAATRVVRAAPDGHTLFFTTSNLPVGPSALR